MSRQFCRSILLTSIFLAASLSGAAAFAGPRVDIVIGQNAPALERLAADELTSQLKRIYEADVKIAATVPADAPHVLFVGSPDTNAHMKPFADSWPSGDKKLTDQGLLLRSVTHNNKPALLIGGGSPVATYWAVAEFGHHLGIRSLLFGDLDPVSPPPFALEGIDVVREPKQREREWHFRNLEPMDSGSWGLDEHRRVLQQLAKLKFNRVSINVRASQPFVHFEFGGVSRKSEGLWGFRQNFYPVSGDTLGRKVFGGAKFFENPSFADAKTYEQRIAAGTKHLNGIIDAAHAGGMTIQLHLSPDCFPDSFARFVQESKGLQGRYGPHVSSDPAVFFRNRKTMELARAQLQAYLSTYPELDGVNLEFGSDQVSSKQFQQVFPDRTFWRRADGRMLDVRVRKNSPFLFVPLEKLDEKTVSNQAPIWIELRGIEEFLPNTYRDLPSPHEQQQLRNNAALQAEPPVQHPRSHPAFRIDAEGASDLDAVVYWLSRVSFDETITFDAACRELLDSVCGEGVADRVLAAFARCQSAQRNLQRVHFGGGMSGPVDLRTLASIPDGEALKLTDATTDYLEAMNEMYRANTRAREGGRAFTLYWARRFEFAFEYLNFAQAVSRAGIAEQKNDSATQIAELEKAIEALNNALNAMAAVARSNSDRGLIAELNEYGYRPLKKKLAEAAK